MPDERGTAQRIRAIDWLRGVVMVLMTVDHAGSKFDAFHLHGDKAGVALSPLPVGEFLTRWVTHLCAPTFVLLAGAALALSSEKRRGEPGQAAFIVKRGLLIAALDPLWMSFGFALYHVVVFQVLYAIGLSLVCMAFLRRLSSRTLLVAAVLIQLLGELSERAHFAWKPLQIVWSFLFTGGQYPPLVIAYPLVPWLSMMMAGWVLGRWLLATPTLDHLARARRLALLGLALLVVFAVVRGIDGYGNWGLYRASLEPLQWLHVAKYPPSIAFTTLELGLAFLLLALFCAVDDERPRRLLQPLALFGATAFFYYLLHVHLLGLLALLLHNDPRSHGLAKTWIASVVVVVALYPLCVLYRRYKARHPNGWARYI